MFPEARTYPKLTSRAVLLLLELEDWEASYLAPPLRNSEGETPLPEAAFWTHPEATKALLGAGADINLPTGDNILYGTAQCLEVQEHGHTATD